MSFLSLALKSKSYEPLLLWVQFCAWISAGCVKEQAGYIHCESFTGDFFACLINYNSRNVTGMY